LIAFLVIARVAFAGNAFHVRTNGSSTNSGTSGSPWNLQTALNQPAAVHAGDTIFIHAGDYTDAQYNVNLMGTSSLPIVVRSYPGELPRLISSQGWNDVVQFRNSSYVWLWGLEITSSSSFPLDQPGTGVNFANGLGTGIKLIDCIIHDVVGIGVNWDTASSGGEINGCLIYYNGREEGDGNNAHAYGIYAQNLSVRKVFKNNVIPYNWSYALHGYSEDTQVSRLTQNGNVLMQSGWMYHNPNGGAWMANLIIGGSGEVEYDSLLNSVLYYSSDASRNTDHPGTWVGYDTTMQHWGMSGNTVIGGQNLFRYSGTIMGNTFYGTSGDNPSGNTYASIPGSGTSYTIFPSDYEPGRAILVIYNWSGNASVNVDLSSVIVTGSPYTIKDALNYFGTAVASGSSYGGGNLSIPMNAQSTSVSEPVLGGAQNDGSYHRSVPQGFGVDQTYQWSGGNSTVHYMAPFNTQPEFGVFIVASAPVNAKVKFYLQGPSVSSTDTMSNALNTSRLLASHYGATPIPGLAVDSVNIEIRNSPTNPTMRAFAPAWLLTDGTIRGFDDTTKAYVGFPGVPAGNYYIVVCHRNHLAVISSVAVSIDGSVTPAVYDFSTGQGQAFGTWPPMIQTGAHYSLIGGNAHNADAVIDAFDTVAARNNLGAKDYNLADVNMDGVVNDLDRTIVTSNLGQSSQVLYSSKFRAVIAPGDGENPVSTLKVKAGGGMVYEYQMEQNHPNPFNPSTQIGYSLPEPGSVSIAIYDVLGREIANLADGYKQAGRYSVTWNATQNSGVPVSSGVYFARMRVMNDVGGVKFTKTTRLLLMK
jgi:hypothetical protein